jgi:hypothetical protein
MHNYTLNYCELWCNSNLSNGTSEIQISFTYTFMLFKSEVFSPTSCGACVSLLEDVFGSFPASWQGMSCVSSHHLASLQLPIVHSVLLPHPSPGSLVMVSFLKYH